MSVFVRDLIDTGARGGDTTVHWGVHFDKNRSRELVFMNTDSNTLINSVLKGFICTYPPLMRVTDLHDGQTRTSCN